MRNWILGAFATALVSVGCLVAFPGRDGQHLCGIVLMIAGLNCVLAMYKKPR
jgi:hypothetical protein